MKANNLQLFMVDFMNVTGITLRRMTRNDHHKNRNDFSRAFLQGTPGTIT
jgi:hypothetical protein